jgi:VWFA-related protein
MGLEGVTSRRFFLQSALGVGAITRLLAAQDASFSTTVRVVNILASVRDKKGLIVRGLTKEDFVLEEDGRAQTIKFFSQESDLPLTLGLLVDTSMSQMRVLPQERTASYKFLDRVLRPE